MKLTSFLVKTRDTVLAAYNIGLNDVFRDLAARGEDLLQEHGNWAPQRRPPSSACSRRGSRSFKPDQGGRL